MIECKDYSKPVPVDDVEEFSAKLSQCFGKNVKGLIISSNTLQKGALKLALSHGIGVGRIIEDRIDMIQYHIGDTSVADMIERERETYDSEAPGAILEEDHAGTITSFGVYDSFFIINDISISSFPRAISALRNTHAE